MAGRGEMVKEVDVRGLPCPRPVVETRKALKELKEGTITVVVDRVDSRENVQRFARSQGCEVKVREKDGIYYLDIVKGETIQCEEVKSGAVILIGSDRLGTGDRELGEKLMASFLKTMCDNDPKPEKLLFLNDGVKLTVESSHVLDSLELLEKEGVQIFSCGTCLEHYGLVEKLRVGLVTNMYDIVNSLLGADKVIKI